MRIRLDLDPLLRDQGYFTDEQVAVLKEALGLRIHSRKGKLMIQGDEKSVVRCQRIIENVQESVERGSQVSVDKLRTFCDFHTNSEENSHFSAVSGDPHHQPNQLVAGKTVGQREYIRKIHNNVVTICSGPAGTGKTFLAVGVAVQYLLASQVDSIVLVRPAVEAGEKLGFLPGDMKEKVRPYLMPIYDALKLFLGPTRVENLLEKEVIEIAPLAYMRGRTLNRSFLILDEAQNTTIEQMKMFLTRIGEGSKAVITGDSTQVDLQGQPSGLPHARYVLQGVEGVAFSDLESSDVVRHPVVRAIVEAYARHVTDNPLSAPRRSKTVVTALPEDGSDEDFLEDEKSE